MNPGPFLFVAILWLTIRVASKLIAPEVRAHYGTPRLSAMAGAVVESRLLFVSWFLVLSTFLRQHAAVLSVREAKNFPRRQTQRIRNRGRRPQKPASGAVAHTPHIVWYW